ncbi:hypothetical protein JL721_5878 [Aureococcus anophagefferens]|nr:hypothetical protein JL721_5878 [Aureococcus anophagefferens]
MLRRALRPAAIACSGFYVTRNDGPRDDDARVKQLLKQTDKARQHAQERVPHAGTFMMGVVPKQWLEVLDEKHRYGSILYPYWQRWETSRTRMSFFMWLDEGRGCLVDLPDCPRRFLEECEVLYLTRDELRLFEVEIRDGLLVWLADGEPVDLHDGAAAAAPTLPAAAAAALVDAQLVRSARREARRRGARGRAAPPPGVDTVSREDRERILAPLVAEGCLRKLRDPYHALRSQAKPSDDELHEYDRLWDAFKVRDAAEARYGLPSELPEATWGAVARALDHDDGLAGRRGGSGRCRASRTARSGIFVVDHFATCTPRARSAARSTTAR